MKTTIILFSILMVTMGLILLIRPKAFSKHLLDHADSITLHVLAAAVRIVLGVALIIYAPLSRSPLALEILGWMALVAGVILALLPPSRFKQLMQWALNAFGRFLPVAALAALAFAAFLIYAVI